MLEISHLTKRYGALTAVDDVTFNVAPGEVLGFLGPNGAGKSTTMKVITGFLAPTSGSVRVIGHDIETDSLDARREMGYLPEGAPGYGEMTVRSFLDFIADIRGLTGAARRARFDDVVARLGLAAVLRQVIETLSKGFRRRVGLAQAILHDPRVLILDEPTDGLDPNQKHEVRTLINDLAKDKIIVISTHILEEVDAVCTRAIIISGGRLLADDTPRGLESRSRWHGAVSLRLAPDVGLQAAREQLAGGAGVGAVEVTGPRSVTVFGRGPAPLLPTVSELAKRSGWGVEEIRVERGRLDEVFRDITQGRDARSAAHA
jgi:ABC-2 type transport system ATP-binding protein